MRLDALFPPTLIRRALDDLSAIADAARRLPAFENQVVGRMDAIQAQLDDVRDELAPMRQIPAVRESVESLPGRLDDVRDELAPMREIPAVRESVESLPGQLDHLTERIGPIEELHAVRKGIEPLDEDMRVVRESVDGLEPLMRSVLARLEAMDSRIDALRGELSPVGELAQKVPGVG